MGSCLYFLTVERRVAKRGKRIGVSQQILTGGLDWRRRSQSYRRDVELCAHYDRDNMKELTVSLVVVVVMAGFVFGQDANKSQEPVTVSKALELGEEGLTQYTGLSEVRQDEAAEYYATAKRLTTEQALGQKSVQLVIDLQNWREAISACRKSIDSMAYVVNGGGTMYSHGQRRDVSAVESFSPNSRKICRCPTARVTQTQTK